MRFHTLAYDESFDSAALSRVTPVGSPIDTIVNTDYFLVPDGFSRIGGVLALGVSATRARIVAPSLSGFAFPEIAPIDIAAEPTTQGPFLDVFANPIELKVGESLSVEMSEGGATTRVHALLFLPEGTPEQVSGQIITLRFTNASTLVADAWTNGALTAASDVPAGSFDVVGMRYEGAGAIAARLVLRGESSYRPGCIGYDAGGDVENYRFRRGGLGVWGSFTHLTTPTVDFLSVSADTSQVVWLDVIYNP